MRNPLHPATIATKGNKRSPRRLHIHPPPPLYPPTLSPSSSSPIIPTLCSPASPPPPLAPPLPPSHSQTKQDTEALNESHETSIPRAQQPITRAGRGDSAGIQSSLPSSPAVQSSSSAERDEGRVLGSSAAQTTAPLTSTRLWGLTVMVLVLMVLMEGTLAQDSIIRLRQGNVQGVIRETNERQVYAYLGIPYAKPPVDQLRFQPPIRHEGWTTTLFANEFGAVCPQPFLTGMHTSEDCLTINVWIPELPRGFRQYPVVVLMEGELFVTSAPSRFPGQDLAAVDLIVVSFNYRTNAFGFLSWEDRVLPGNLGLRDQSLALQWVAENVDKFGGDLTKVTLLGHSAGAASAAYHLVHPRSQGPFQQMILMSGTHLAPWALSRQPRVAARRLSKQLGCGYVSGSSYLLGCIRKKNADQIVQAVESLFEDGNPHLLFAPVVDTFLPPEERMVPLQPLSAIRESANRRIPLLLGLSEDDGSVMLYLKREINNMGYDDLRRYAHEILVPLVTTLAGFGTNAEVVKRMVEYAYPDKALPGDTFNLVLEIVKLFTAGMFNAPVVRTAEEASRRGLNTHLFVNTFVSRDIYRSNTNISGALHGAELAYLFSPAAYRKLFNLPLTYNEEQLSRRLKQMVYNFAISGLPYMAQYSPRWGRFTPESPTYASLESGQVHSAYQMHQMTLWNRLLPELNVLDQSSSGGTTLSTANPSTGDPTTEQQIIRPGDGASYQSAVWVLVGVVLVLLGVIVAYIVCSRRRKRLNSGTLQSQ
ncbi:venom carboxylesterase-6-like [Eriocheir sinensis]|uniref:venom carboxylesterase-6-like n=1 Tax=Eriocheir sinensis TaxID=95602 RepID=UPI0021C94F38|nr:venom carboxylesterase-6-like [Eriocheir sinensis]